MARATKRIVVTLGSDELAWIEAHGSDPAALLRALLAESMRATLLRKAVAEEDHLLALIRRRAKELRQAAPPGPFDGVLAEQLLKRAQREVLRKHARVDRQMRAAVERVRFRWRPETGRIDNRFHRTAELQRLRLQRPGGWR